MLTPESAANWQSAYNLSYYVLLVALFVSFVATGLTFIANNRLTGDLTARLTYTTKSAGEANERAAKLEKDAAESRERTRLADERVAELMLRLQVLNSGRGLSQQQITDIASALATFKNTTFDVALTEGDPEAANFLPILEYVLKDAGWDQADWPSTDPIILKRDNFPVVGFKTAYGLVFTYNQTNAESLKSAAESASAAFNQSGIKSIAQMQNWNPNLGHSSLDPSRIHVVIGKKAD